MTDLDKAGNVFDAHCDKRVAQPDEGPVFNEETVMSRRGVGHHWKVGMKHDMPVLFGAGGEQDGVTAFIQTHANTIKEEECALHGMGDDTMDQNRYQRNQANANTEFNFSQYKSGALHDQRGKVLPGEGVISLETVQGLATGDMTIKVNPYSDLVDMTTQAVGAVFGHAYKEDSGGIANPKIAANPFKHKSKEDEDKPAEGPPDPAVAEVEDEDGMDIDYYFNDSYYDGKEAEEELERDRETGMRRINMKTNQGRQLKAMVTKEHIMAAYQEANNSYAQTLKDQAGKAYMSGEEKEKILGKLRQPTSKFQANQQGIGELSKNRSKQLHRQGGKLNTVLVGV